MENIYIGGTLCSASKRTPKGTPFWGVLFGHTQVDLPGTFASAMLVGGRVTRAGGTFFA